MALNDAALVLAANAADTAITHMQLHSAAASPGYTTNLLGSRVAVNGAVDGDGDISWTVNFTGLGANAAVHSISYWSASSGGTNYGGSVRGGGDATANAAGEYTATVTETFSAS